MRRRDKSVIHSVISDSATPWTVAHQVPLSMGFSRQEYWSGLLFLLQRIFLTQGFNPGLLHCRWILQRLSHKGNPRGMGTRYNQIPHSLGGCPTHWREFYFRDSPTGIRVPNTTSGPPAQGPAPGWGAREPLVLEVSGAWWHERHRIGKQRLHS